MAKRTARPMPEVREPRHQVAREDLRRPHRPGRGQRSIDRIHRRWPTAHLVHLPLHASWLSKVEIYFSVLQRKVLTPTTSRARRKSPRGSSRSRTTTSRSLTPSSGSSAAATSTACWLPPPHQPPASASPDTSPKFRSAVLAASPSGGSRDGRPAANTQHAQTRPTRCSVGPPWPLHHYEAQP